MHIVGEKIYRRLMNTCTYKLYQHPCYTYTLHSVMPSRLTKLRYWWTTSNNLHTTSGFWMSCDFFEIYKLSKNNSRVLCAFIPKTRSEIPIGRIYRFELSDLVTSGGLLWHMVAMMYKALRREPTLRAMSKTERVFRQLTKISHDERPYRRDPIATLYGSSGYLGYMVQRETRWSILLIKIWFT